MRIVEDREDRLTLGRCGEQLQYAGVGEEGVHLPRLCQRQAPAQHVGRCVGHLVERPEHREQQLV